MSYWLEGLNPEQIEAVKHNNGPQLILAGAGSGKTTVLIARAGRLISENKCKTEELLLLTFTNKAAREIKERIIAKLGKQGQSIWAGTFHSFGLLILKEYGKHVGLPKRFSIVSQNEAQGIIKDVMKNLNVYGKDGFDVAKLQWMLSAWKEKGQRKAMTEDPYEEMTELLLPKYQERLKELGAVDFDHLIYYPIEILTKYPDIKAKVRKKFPYVMIDEFQDTNLAQMKLVKLIVDEEKPNLSVVGDDDQSIYGWRGAEIKNILNFPKTYKDCQTVKLIRNYRCNPAILELANHVIRKNTTRHDKDLIAERKEAPKKPELFVFESEEDEADKTIFELQRLFKKKVSPKEIAILYRSNSQGAFLESYLRRERIPYKISGNTGFFDRKEVKDVLSFVHAALYPSDIHYRRILNTPSRGIGMSTIEVLQNTPGSFVHNAKNWRVLDISQKSGHAIENLNTKLYTFKRQLAAGAFARQAIEHFLDEIEYKSHVRKLAKDADAFGKQWMIIDVLLNVLDSFQKKKPGKEGLSDFLETMELRDYDSNEDKAELQLLTFHACKGLEFSHVFLLGLEEDLLPHARLGNDVSEERRLFYVAITRAKTSLIFSYNRFRKRMGRRKAVAPSRFLLEIPKDSYVVFENGRRPITETDRTSLVADFLKSLD